MRYLLATLSLISAVAARQQIILSTDTVSRSSTAPWAHCPVDPPLSCPVSKDVDRCCTNTPGGQMLLTQFWDAEPTYGPLDSWTIHGLWPDHCDGTFDALCDHSRFYGNISAILTAGGGQEALDFMRIYWKDYKGQDDQFWEHEWNKHGTCISTLEVACYGATYTPQLEVVAFFNKTVEIFKTLPTYKWFTEAGIVPSRTATYSLKQLQDVAVANFGKEVIFGCQRGLLNEVWYGFTTKGTVQGGDFVPAAPDGTKSTCPQNGIRWIPKHEGGPPSPHPPGPPGGKVFIEVVPASDNPVKRGCLISTGKWLVGATCAGFSVTEHQDGSVSLATSKGNCAFTSRGTFVCQGGQKAESFAWDQEGNLQRGGSSTFYAAGLPSGYSQLPILSGKAALSVHLRKSS